ncbi:M23 family metallopeptidase [candidate division KSB1 bacterium]
MKTPLIIISFLLLTSCAPIPSPPMEEEAVPVVEKVVEVPENIRVIKNAMQRVTKKPFGIYVNPSNSPVSPEKFAGYHTGVDFETFGYEQDTDVEIFAFCGGELVLKRMATGYGGVTIQRCVLDGGDVTVLYGHLDLESIEAELGDGVSEGDKIGILGDGYGEETDGERKHLHLGIHKGKSTNLLGYVQDAKLLSEWIDPMTLINE